MSFLGSACSSTPGMISLLRGNGQYGALPTTPPPVIAGAAQRTQRKTRLSQTRMLRYVVMTECRAVACFSSLPTCSQIPFGNALAREVVLRNHEQRPAYIGITGKQEEIEAQERWHSQTGVWERKEIPPSYRWTKRLSPWVIAPVGVPSLVRPLATSAAGSIFGAPRKVRLLEVRDIVLTWSGGGSKI